MPKELFAETISPLLPLFSLAALIMIWAELRSVANAASDISRDLSDLRLRLGATLPTTRQAEDAARAQRELERL